MKKLIAIICFFVLVAYSYTHADTIILKRGEKIRAEEAWEEDGQIKFRRGDAVFGFPRNIVERLEVETKTISPKQTGKMEYLSIIKELSPGYEGDNPKAVYDKLAEFDKIRSKQEFEDTNSYKARLGELVHSPIVTKTYIFKPTELRPEPKYDADQGILRIEFIGYLDEECRSRRYVGSNAFGAQALIDSEHCDRYLLNIQNEKEIAAALGTDKSRSLFGSTPFATVKLEPLEARRSKEHIRLLYVCRPIPIREFAQPYKEDCKSEDPLECPFTEFNTSGHDATLNDPSEYIIFNYRISVILLELIVYNDKTGQILKRLGPF